MIMGWNWMRESDRQIANCPYPWSSFLPTAVLGSKSRPRIATGKLGTEAVLYLVQVIK